MASLNELKKELKRNLHLERAKLYNENNFLYIYMYGPGLKEYGRIEIKYNNKKEKEEIIKEILKLLKAFDFSFFVEFYNIEELKTFVNTLYY